MNFLITSKERDLRKMFWWGHLNDKRTIQGGTKAIQLKDVDDEMKKP